MWCHCLTVSPIDCRSILSSRSWFLRTFLNEGENDDIQSLSRAGMGWGMLFTFAARLASFSSPVFVACCAVVPAELQGWLLLHVETLEIRTPYWSFSMLTTDIIMLQKTQTKAVVFVWAVLQLSEMCLMTLLWICCSVDALRFQQKTPHKKSKFYVTVLAVLGFTVMQPGIYCGQCSEICRTNRTFMLFCGFLWTR